MTSIAAYAQVSGTVVDLNGKPIADTWVFANGTTAATMTGEAGVFELRGIPVGFAELVVYKPGYVLSKSRMRIRSGVISTIKLKIDKERKKKKGTEPTGLPQTIVNEALGMTQYIIGNTSFYTVEESTDASVNIGRANEMRRHFEGTSRNWLLSLLNNKTDNRFTIENGTVNASEPSAKSEYTRFDIKGPLKVIYHADDSKLHESIITPKGSVEINNRGILLDPNALEITGAMAATGSYSPLPLDYEPPTGNIDSLYRHSVLKMYEKVYVQTDKPYYYSGEKIWFKAFVNYYYQPWKDTLSKVLYVELIGDEKEIVAEQSLEIIKGHARGSIHLPRSLPVGTYFIRAYTNLQRNFGDENLFIRPIQLLGLMSKPVADAKRQSNESAKYQVTLKADKERYRTRDKIQLSINVVDQNGQPLVSDLALSVVDAAQVMDVPQSIDIKQSLSFDPSSLPREGNLLYPKDEGVNIDAVIMANGRPVKDQLSITPIGKIAASFAESDENGAFTLTNLQFYDTTTLLVRPLTEVVTKGNVEVVKRQPADIFLPAFESIKTVDANSVQRILNMYEASDSVTMLSDVVVRARREVVQVPQYSSDSPYGSPDVRLEEKDINQGYSNLLYALQGRIAGLIVRQTETGEWVVYTKRSEYSSSFGGQHEVLLMIDNVAVGGSAALTLSQINPQTVKAIEVTKRINVLYGGAGAYGVVNVITKTGSTIFGGGPNKSIPIHVTGFQSPEIFYGPNYSVLNDANLDSRSLLHWDSNLSTNGSNEGVQVSFYASDLAGDYRVTIEGVTANGEPVRGTYIIKCDER